MSETFLTNCPHCKSVFKLRKEHLEVASGHVRCGNCHSLFLATDSLVSLDKESQKAQNNTSSNGSNSPQGVTIVEEVTSFDGFREYRPDEDEDE